MPESRWGTLIDYEKFSALGAVVGHGRAFMFDNSVDMGAQASFAMEFCAVESCGKRTPSRIVSVRRDEVIHLILAGANREANLELLSDLCKMMVDGSLWAMGEITPFPVHSVMKQLPQEL